MPPKQKFYIQYKLFLGSLTRTYIEMLNRGNVIFVESRTCPFFVFIRAAYIAAGHFSERPFLESNVEGLTKLLQLH